MPTERKATIIRELTDQLARSRLTIITDYRGLKVGDLQGLRATLRPLDAEFRVAKNTLTGRAADSVGVTGLETLLAGPTALVLAYDNIVAVTKAVTDFARTSRILTIRAGVLGNQVLAPPEVEAIATLPPREELQARLVGLLASPLTRTVTVLAGPSRSMAYLLQARADQLGGGGGNDHDQPPEAEAAD